MSSKKIIVDTPYGECLVRVDHYKRGVTPTIQTAIDKSSYFSNMANEKHEFKYTYNKVVYKNASSNVIITCGIHGDFLQTPNGHLSGKGCNKCAEINRRNKKRNTHDEFLMKAGVVHNFKYNYDKCTYFKQSERIIVICPIHGEFSITAKDHLSGRGCMLCGRESISKHRSEEPTGWSLTDWILASERSSRFDSFKVYIIRCFNESEEFIKVGRTYNKVSWRFRNKVLLPYEFNVLNEIVGSAKFVFDKENELKRIIKEFKYIPNISFSGMQECFSMECINLLTNNIR
jgi:hypothetical protein